MGSKPNEEPEEPLEGAGGDAGGDSEPISTISLAANAGGAGR